LVYYSDIDKVKRRVRATGSGEDTYLAELQAEADAIIDNVLKKYTTVPLTTVPEIIKQIATDLTAGIYLENQYGKPHILKVRAELNLERYIRTTWLDALYQRSPPEIQQ